MTDDMTDMALVISNREAAASTGFSMEYALAHAADRAHSRPSLTSRLPLAPSETHKLTKESCSELQILCIHICKQRDMFELLNYRPTKGQLFRKIDQKNYE